MSRSAPLFTKPRAGKLSPNRATPKITAINTGATRDVIDAANTVIRRYERAEPLRHHLGRRA